MRKAAAEVAEQTNTLEFENDESRLAETRGVVGSYCMDREREFLRVLKDGHVFGPAEDHEFAWYVRLLRLVTEQPAKTEHAGKLFCGLVRQQPSAALANRCIGGLEQFDLDALPVLLECHNPARTRKHPQPANRMEMLTASLRRPDTELEATVTQLQRAGLVEAVVYLREPPMRPDTYALSIFDRERILHSPCTTEAGDLLCTALDESAGGDRPERITIHDVTNARFNGGRN